MNPFMLAERIGDALVAELERGGVDIIRFALTGEARVPMRSSAIASISYTMPVTTFGSMIAAYEELTGGPRSAR